MTAERARRAEDRARFELEALDDWVWDREHLPVPVERIAEERYGLLVEDRDHLTAGPGEAHVSGVLLPDRALILVDRLEAARSAGRRRFTIAHELGHLVLHDGRPSSRSTTSFPIHDRAEPRALRYPDAELEANQFAAGVLMPADLIDLPRDTPETVSDRFAVSLPAAAVRLEYLRWTESPSGCQVPTPSTESDHMLHLSDGG